jgi:hypothetical protein
MEWAARAAAVGLDEMAACPLDSDLLERSVREYRFRPRHGSSRSTQLSGKRSASVGSHNGCPGVERRQASKDTLVAGRAAPIK